MMLGVVPAKVSEAIRNEYTAYNEKYGGEHPRDLLGTFV